MIVGYINPKGTQQPTDKEDKAMVRFYLEKLVRDKLVEKCKADPQVLHTEYYQLDRAAYRRELQRKIHEEANEIPLGDDRLEEALQELADVQAVLDA
ncbi:MAG: hypothetical protein D8B38_01615, partial [Candidatus Saccharimonas sp.]